MPTGYFYSDVLLAAQRTGVIDPSMNVLVVAGGPLDKDMLLAEGYRDVVISNVSALDTMANAVSPYRWSQQDAEHLTFDDNSFDAVLVHAGLHHCYSPHRALAEMYRVARKAVVVIEARDSLTMRLAVALGMTSEYEIEAVVGSHYASGGVADSVVPNYVYRWTEREFEKVLRSVDPSGNPQVHYLYGFRFNRWRQELLQNPVRRRLTSVMGMFGKLLHKVAPKQGNSFAAIIRKHRDPSARFPWLMSDASGLTINREWCDAHFSHD